MPLVVLAGQPASGKSTAAARLRELLAPHGPVELVDEPSLHLDRNVAYSGGRPRACMGTASTCRRLSKSVCGDCGVVPPPAVVDRVLTPARPSPAPQAACRRRSRARP
jgi:hypothetical protein